MEQLGQTEKDEIFSKRVPAGKRTYFFDVKATRGNELYMTITESKKRFRDDGTYFYDKHKIFLYREDFEKFLQGLNEAMDYVDANQGPIAETGGAFSAQSHAAHSAPISENRIQDINFDDLGS